MNVRIITDSTSDIAPKVAHALGIKIVPVYVHIGNEIYRDGVDLSTVEFYHKLVTSYIQLTTSPPAPEDFTRVYLDCSQKADAIVSIHISAKVSGTYDSAQQGKKRAKGECRIEVIDSHFGSVGLALVVMAAARIAKSGRNLQSVLEETQKAINQVHLLGIVETMKYLVLGGRASEATASIADILNIKPLLTFKKGEIVRAGLSRKSSIGIDRLYEFVESNLSIQDLAIAHSTVPEHASQLKARLGSIFHEKKIHVTEIGAALGVHLGPGALIVALRRGD